MTTARSVGPLVTGAHFAPTCSAQSTFPLHGRVRLVVRVSITDCQHD